MCGGGRGQRRRGRSGDSVGWASRSHHGTGTGVGEPPWRRGRRQEAATALAVAAAAATTLEQVAKSRDSALLAAESQTSGVSAKTSSVSAMYSRWRACGLVTGPLNGLKILNRAEIFGLFSFTSGQTEWANFAEIQSIQAES